MDLQEIFADPEIHQSVCRNLTFGEVNDLRKAYHLPVLHCPYTVIYPISGARFALPEVNEVTGKFFEQLQQYSPLRILLDAINNDDFQLLELLSQLNVVKNYSFAGNVPVLISEAQNGNIKAVKFLLDHGADPNAEVIDKRFVGWTQRYWTAIHYAIQNNHFEIVKLLIERGAKLEVDIQTHLSALDTAINNKRYEIANYLIDLMSLDFPRYQETLNWALNYAMDLTYSPESFAIIQKLLDSGANMYWESRLRMSTFKTSVQTVPINVIKLFLQQEVSQDQLDDALIIAVKRGDQDIFQLLLDAGANINRFPVIAIGIEYGGVNKFFLKYLIKAGADVNNPIIEDGEDDEPAIVRTPLAILFQQLQHYKIPHIENDPMVLLLKSSGAHL